MYSRTFEATSNGEASVDLYGYGSNIEIVADPACRMARVEVYTEASSGPSVDVIDALPGIRGNDLRVHLPEGAGSSGGMMVAGSGNVVISSGGDVAFQGRGFSSFMSGGGGDSDMNVNGNRIRIRGGRTWVNGVEITDQGGGGEPAGDPPMPIHFRAVVPYGSAAVAETYNGDISVADVSQVALKSYSGDIKATGLAAESTVQTYSGDITIGAVGNLRPEVRAETYSGDIRVLDDNIRVRPKTYSGGVRYPR